MKHHRSHACRCLLLLMHPEKKKAPKEERRRRSQTFPELQNTKNNKARDAAEMGSCASDEERLHISSTATSPRFNSVAQVISQSSVLNCN